MFTFYVSLALLISPAVFVNCSWFKTARENTHFRYENPEIGKDGMTMVRLPKHTRPVQYKLSIVPNLTEDFTFTSRLEIEIAVLKPTKDVYLYSKGLNITYASISLGRLKIQTVFKLEPKNQILKLHTRHRLVVRHRYLLNITFKGFLNNDMMGFYRSYYKIGNTTKWLATTKFEPTYARMAFPCYDEPGFKARFNISVARYPNQNAISNMPLKSTSEPDPAIDNRVWDNFEVTPPMPTYLVAFIVSEFSHIPGSPKNFSVWARENAIEDTTYIMNEGQKLLKQMENFTGIPYDLPKMDLAAIPDFPSGAMENWGLTTYKERYVMFNPKVCPTKSLELVTAVVAHELSHQWFGDRVTPTWWDYTWLNEAFATYFEYYITAEVEPTWRMDQLFVVEAMHSALFVDEAGCYHGMTKPVNTPPEIKSIFDTIIYEKGGSVLRMLEHVVSPPNYKKALNIYLTKGYEAGGSVTPDHLWVAFEKQIQGEDVMLPHGMTITNIMGNWTKNRGYPLIKVSRHVDGKMVNITIEQETYKTPRSRKIVTPDQSWAAPIKCTKQSEVDFHTTKPSFWSLPEKPITRANEVEQHEWILCNIQQTGYYRVKYDSENWKLLIKQLYSNYSVIHPVNRAQLIDDACCLAIDHKLSFLIPLELLKYLHNETDAIPLFAALNNLSYLYRRFRETSFSYMLKNYITDLIKPVYDRFGFDNKPTDDHLTRTWRSALVSFACALKIEECQTAAENEYAKNESDLSGINPEVKSAVFCIMLNTDHRQTVWNSMWTLFRTSNVAWELETTLRSFACVEDTALLKEYLYKLIDQDDADIRSQYHGYVLGSVFSTTNGIDACFEIIDELVPKFSNMSSDSMKMLEKLIGWLAGRVDSEEHMKWVNRTISELEKRDQKMYGRVLSGLLLVQRSAVERSEHIKITGEKLSAALESMYPSTNTTSPPTSPATSPVTSTPTSPSTSPVITTTEPEPTVKPSVATNIVPTTIVLLLSLVMLCFFSV